jgi:hypothetical protein
LFRYCPSSIVCSAFVVQNGFLVLYRQDVLGKEKTKKTFRGNLKWPRATRYKRLEQEAHNIAVGRLAANEIKHNNNNVSLSLLLGKSLFF